jgi:hypothetical protein
MVSSGNYRSFAPLAERELSPQVESRRTAAGAAHAPWRSGLPGPPSRLWLPRRARSCADQSWLAAHAAAGRCRMAALLGEPQHGRAAAHLQRGCGFPVWRVHHLHFGGAGRGDSQRAQNPEAGCTRCVQVGCFNRCLACQATAIKDCVRPSKLIGAKGVVDSVRDGGFAGWL